MSHNNRSHTQRHGKFGHQQAQNPLDSQATSDTNHPLHDVIAAKAYALYEDRNRQDGHDLEHWLEAEARVRNTASGPASVPAL
jgi:hypothetical protein